MKVKLISTIGLVAVIVQYFSWTRMIATPGDPTQQDDWGLVYLVSGAVWSLSFAMAFCLFFVRRFTTHCWAKPIGVLLALVLIFGLGFAALYWPWFLTSY